MFVSALSLTYLPIFDLLSSGSNSDVTVAIPVESKLPSLKCMVLKLLDKYRKEMASPHMSILNQNLHHHYVMSSRLLSFFISDFLKSSIHLILPQKPHTD